MALAIATAEFSRFDRLTFVSRRMAQAGLGGEHRSRRRAPSTDFIDYRPYQPGDDFRRIDWNAYGRLGTLQVKLTEGRERLDVVLVLDCSASMTSGVPNKLPFAAQVVAALGYIALARSDSVRIVALHAEEGVVLGPLQGRGRLIDVVSFLEQVESSGRVELNTALPSHVPLEGRPRLVVLVSDVLVASGMAEGLDRLISHWTDVAVVHVVSPDEADPQLAGEVELIDVETDERLELGASLATLAAYRTRYASWLEEQARVCAERGVRYARVQSDRPVAEVLLHDLRSAGLLR